MSCEQRTDRGGGLRLRSPGLRDHQVNHDPSRPDYKRGAAPIHANRRFDQACRGERTGRPQPRQSRLEFHRAAEPFAGSLRMHRSMISGHRRRHIVGRSASARGGSLFSIAARVAAVVSRWNGRRPVVIFVQHGSEAEDIGSGIDLHAR